MFVISARRVWFVPLSIYLEQQFSCDQSYIMHPYLVNQPSFGACCGAKSVLSVPNIVHRWQSRRRLGAEFDKTKRSLRENEMLVELSYQADLARARPTSCYTSRLSLRNFFTLLTSIQTRKRIFFIMLYNRICVF